MKKKTRRCDSSIKLKRKETQLNKIINIQKKKIKRTNDNEISSQFLGK